MLMEGDAGVSRGGVEKEQEEEIGRKAATTGKRANGERTGGCRRKRRKGLGGESGREGARGRDRKRWLRRETEGTTETRRRQGGKD